MQQLNTSLICDGAKQLTGLKIPLLSRDNIEPSERSDTQLLRRKLNLQLAGWGLFKSAEETLFFLPLTGSLILTSQSNKTRRRIDPSSSSQTDFDLRLTRWTFNPCREDEVFGEQNWVRGWILSANTETNSRLKAAVVLIGQNYTWEHFCLSNLHFRLKFSDEMLLTSVFTVFEHEYLYFTWFFPIFSYFILPLLSDNFSY